MQIGGRLRRLDDGCESNSELEKEKASDSVVGEIIEGIG